MVVVLDDAKLRCSFSGTAGPEDFSGLLLNHGS